MKGKQMQERKHTPGPWESRKDDAYPPRHLLTSKGRTFGAFLGWSPDGETTDDEDAANLRVIKAAPAMLDALNLVLHHNGHLTGGDWATICAAIEAAEGPGKPAIGHRGDTYVDAQGETRHRSTKGAEQ